MLIRKFLAGLLVSLLAFAPAETIAPLAPPVISVSVAAAAFTPLVPAKAHAATAAQNAVVLGGIQNWSLPGSSADLYFARNAGSCAINRLARSCASLLSTTRASTGYAQWADGHYSSFGNNVPRITDQGLLVEQAATNIALQSQTFNTSPWVKSAVTVNQANTTAPDSTTTGNQMVENSASANHNVAQDFGTKAASALVYTYTVFAKANSRSRIVLWLHSSATANRAQAQYDLSAVSVISSQAVGSFSSVTATITPAGNGWYRCAIMATSDTDTDIQGRVFMTDNTATATAPAYQGDGVSNLWIWQSDMVQAAFPTSPILTTTGSTTRAADVITLTGAARTAALAAKSLFAITNLAQNLQRLIDFNGVQSISAPNSTTLQITNGTNTASAVIGNSGTITGRVKSAYGMGASLTILSNGGSMGTSANAWGSPSAPVYLGNRADGTRATNGFIERLALGQASTTQFNGLTQ